MSFYFYKGTNSIFRQSLMMQCFFIAQLALLACLLLFMSSALATTQQHDEERLFKAAFIYNFVKFTDWPDKTLTHNERKLALCTLGKDLLISDLKLLGGKTIKKQRVDIQEIRNLKQTTNCNILYIAQSEKHHYRKFLAETTNKPILTISEINDFSSTGGIVELYQEKGRTRFIINLELARNAGLSISSRLLILARVIDSETKH